MFFVAAEFIFFAINLTQTPKMDMEVSSKQTIT